LTSWKGQPLQRKRQKPWLAALRRKKALEADRIIAEVEGSVVMVPVRNVKYIEVRPAPPRLPAVMLRGAQRIL
jgi:hypothetical protein